MTTPPRKKIVIDTNVLVRTTFQKRSFVSQRIYQAIAAQECILVTSPEILEEIRDVISRDYIIEYTHTTVDMRVHYMNTLIDLSMLTAGTKPLKKTSRDAKDNKFLTCADEAKADYLVTSDKDLLDLKTYEGTEIIPPQEFAKLLETGKL
jgi:putative PIN family toxin of toxin-antitoxin system